MSDQEDLTSSRPPNSQPKPPSSNARRTRPKRPGWVRGKGKPKKKSSSLKVAALDRGSDFSKVKAITDPVGRATSHACFARAYINGSLLKKEASLTERKWVEYRYMTPLECTERFAGEYIAAYRRAWAKHFDSASAEKKRPVETNFGEITVADMNSLWRARQVADELGVPYDIFLDAQIEGAITGNKWGQPPMPNQLLSGNLVRARVRGRPTREEITERLFARGWDRRFFAPRDTDDPVQAAAFRELRADVLRAGEDSAKRLSKYLRMPGVISEAQARAMFEAGLVDAACTGIGSPPAPGDMPSYQPACMGFRSPDRKGPCRSCEVAAACRNVARRTDRLLIRTKGTKDPRGDHKRSLARERKRRQRQRQSPTDRPPERPMSRSP